MDRTYSGSKSVVYVNAAIASSFPKSSGYYVDPGESVEAQ